MGPFRKAGYKSVVIEPQATSRFGRMSGFMTTPQGRISVEYNKTEKGIDFKISVPVDTQATFRYLEKSYSLSKGENLISIQ